MAISTVVAVLVAALAVYAYLNTGQVSAAGGGPDSMSYNPTSNTLYCDDLGVFGANHTALAFRPPVSDQVPEGTCAANGGEKLGTSVAADTTNVQNTPAGDVNYAAVVTLNPADEQVASTGSVLGLPPLAPGDLVGGLASTPNLGVADGACNNNPEIDFVLYNIALPNGTVTLPANPSDVVPGDGLSHGTATNIAYPRLSQASEGNRFNGWSTSGIPAANSGGTSPLNSPGGTAALFAMHDSIAVQNYPSYLLRVFADKTGTPVIPVALYGGATNVLGTTAMLYFAVFGPSDLTNMAHPLGLIGNGGSMGNPTVTVLQDPSDRAAFPATVTNFCTQLQVKATFLGTARTYTPPTGPVTSTGTQLRHENPASVETGYHIQYNLSQRDTDQDGIENSLDSCPLAVNNGDVRVTGSGDPDNNGLDSVCDPGPQTGTGNPDTDGDGFPNAGDNCPLVSNPLQTDSEQPSAIGAQGSPNPNVDNGPQTDGLGDACDLTSTTITPMQNGVAQSITLDPKIANGRFMIKMLVQAKCFGGTDADHDGYCAEDADPFDSGGCGTGCAVRHAGWSGPQMVMDSDSDFFPDALETYMGTDATKPCAQTPIAPSIAGGASDEPISNFPLDFDDNRLIGLGDVGAYGSVFNKPVNDPGGSPLPGVTLTRWDLDANGLIGLPDVATYGSFFNKRCGQGAVAPGPYAGMPGPYVQQ